MTIKEFGIALKRFRMSKGLTAEQVSEATGIEPTFISQVENGHSGFSFNKAIIILNFYNLSFDDCKKISENNDLNVELIDIKNKIAKNLNEKEIKFFYEILKQHKFLKDVM